VSRVAVLYDPENQAKVVELHATQEGAQRMGLQTVPLATRRVEDFEPAFDTAVLERANGVIVLGGPLFQQNHALLVELATRHKLPAMFETPLLAQQGGLAAYGPVTTDLFRRSVYFVDRILKGTPPSELPVERPSRFDLVVNLQAAQAIDLTIPVQVLQFANQVVP
jgi:putative ABC transport system substrate-binding protein